MSEQESGVVGSAMTDVHAEPGLNEEIAADWATWSRSLGMIALPHLRRLAEEVPELTAGMVCSGDGLNLAAIGVDSGLTGRLAALSSSLFGVAGAHRQVTSGNEDDGSTMVNIAGDHQQAVLLRMEVKNVGQLVVVAAAEDVTLGVLVVAVRNTADALRQFLEGS